MLHLQVESFSTGQAQYIAKDRGKWWQIVDVLAIALNGKNAKNMQHVT
jgi:hypothetical protein